jgi:hypothetical protein
MAEEKKTMSEEDYLKKHLSNLEGTNLNTDIPFDNFVKKDASTVNDLQYFHFDVDQLPCSPFYPKGTLIMIRPALVKEIQAYSMVNDKDFYDIVEKMNYMLQSCVRIKFPDGRIGSYLDVRDQDRLYLVFTIRELTFQKGNTLSVKVLSPCNNDDEEQVDMVRSNFVFYNIDSKLVEFYNSSVYGFEFNLTNGKNYKLIPPTIGLQKCFSDFVIRESTEKKPSNMAFLKIIPFLLGDRTSITYEGIKKELKEFEQMDNISFQFLNSAVSKMTFGIKELRKITECGQEVYTPMQFPGGASAIFAFSDAFETYIKK